MKMVKETYINLEKAYKEKKERVYHPDLFLAKELRKERHKRGLYETCGRKKITKSQKKRGLVNCLKCRKTKRNYH